MKKSLALTLALVFLLGIAGTAFAANPFVDVPANHWAYAAINNLAKAGLVDGMGDGTFQGDKEMTRYEMAQIVAKAMARSDKADAANKALIDKLAAEFSTELNNLGVRVTNLENKVGTVKITGDVRFRYNNLDKAKDQPTHQQRFRLNLSAPVTDTIDFNGRLNLMNQNDMGTDKNINQVSVATITARNILNSFDLMAGRYDFNLGQTNYLAGTVGMTDGVEAKANIGKANILVGYASLKNHLPSSAAVPEIKVIDQVTGKPVIIQKAADAVDGIDNAYYAELNYAFDKNLKMNVNYLKNQENGIKDLAKIYGAGLTATIAENFVLTGDYWKNDGEDAKIANGGDAPIGYVARLQYKGAQKAVPGSFGIAVEALKQNKDIVPVALSACPVKLSQTLADKSVVGVKSMDVGVSYTVAKNVVFNGWYQFNMKDAATGDALPSDKYTRLEVNISF